MKKNILTLLLLISFSSFSQITVLDESNSIKIGEVTQAGVTIINCFKEDNNFTFKYFNNINKVNHNYNFFIIKNKDNDIEKLYSLIAKGFKEKKSNIIKIQTNKEQIGLEFIRAFGITAFRFLQYEKENIIIGYSIALSKKQVKQLFGK